MDYEEYMGQLRELVESTVPPIDEAKASRDQRLYVATAAMSALITVPATRSNYDIAMKAIALADALIAEINRPVQ